MAEGSLNRVNAGGKGRNGVISLMPRQVLLLSKSKHNHSVPAAAAASTMTNNKNNNDYDDATASADSNKTGRTHLLIHSFIAKHFKDYGFSKSLKSFLKESSLQKNDIKADSINLDHIYYEYLAACDNGAKNVNKQKEKAPGQMSEGMAVDPVSSSLKSEEKKTGKRNSDSVSEVVNSSNGSILSESPIDDANEYKKSKKKKKKSKRASDSHVDGVEHGTENLKGTGSENLNDIVKSNYDGSTTDKKSKHSKKRKRHSSEENGSKSGDAVTAEKSKCNRIEDQQNAENVDQPAEKNATSSSDVNKCKGESVRIDLKASKKTPIKELDGQHNGKYENGGQKSALQRTSKKQHESSAEPKTLNVFQRVKVDEVVITDERLKDNSYWAKDGAESGYGAKAQEILGQVRGRDFRHEKTKKKRGSYRGGQIDLQAHSIKFNYSDEDV